MIDKKIVEMHKEKIQRYDNRDVGMGVGAAFNKAMDLVICMINQAPQMAMDEEAIWEKVKKYIDKGYKVMQDKKEYESILVANEPLKSKLTEEQVKNQEQGQKWQEHYNSISKLDDINNELNQ